MSKDKEKVFIAYDFQIKGSLELTIESVAHKPPEGFIVQWPNDPNGPFQGAIWQDAVKPYIDSCDNFLAFIDLPNANVGFEIGYALGKGKKVAWAHIKQNRHSWLKGPPLKGYLLQRLETYEEMCDAIQKSSQWVTLSEQHEIGQDILLLCPQNSGSGCIQRAKELDYNWQFLPEESWDIDTLPKLLHGIGLIIWVLVDHNENTTEGGRDGSENAVLSIIAGYVASQAHLKLHILQHHKLRAIGDVVSTCQSFNNLTQFQSLLRTIAEQWEQQHNAPSTTVDTINKSDSISPLYPACLLPYPDDDWQNISKQFIGREINLTDVKAAFEGIANRKSGNTTSGSHTVRLIWVHGFGGMGKSWFLHQARLQAENRDPQLNSLIIDWDKPNWRQPLSSEPHKPKHLFEAIAYRLAQRFVNFSVADPFWLALAEIKKYSPQREKWQYQFSTQLNHAKLEDHTQINDQFRQVLIQDRLWSNDLTKLRDNIEYLKNDPTRYDELLASFISQCSQESHMAIVHPNKHLANGLQTTLVEILKKYTLLLMIDTAEVLDHELEFWLRFLLTPLLQQPLPLLVFIGNRRRPDINQSQGWQNDLGDKLRIIAFDETIRFTTNDIEFAIKRLPRYIEGSLPAMKCSLPDTALQLHKATLGVPLAVRMVLDLLDEQDENILKALNETHVYPLDENQAIREIIGKVTDRWLMHLSRYERRDDLHDIVALALLLEANGLVLNQLWAQPYQHRLRDLSSRYSLLASGDLHETVRTYLRQCWRYEENRFRKNHEQREYLSEVFNDTLTHLEHAVKAMETPPSIDITEDFAYYMIELNLRCWRKGDAAIGDLAQILVLKLAHKDNTHDVAVLIRHLPLESKLLTETKKLWQQKGDKTSDLPPYADMLTWLRLLQNDNKWQEYTHKCLDLLLTLHKSTQSLKKSDVADCIETLQTTFDYFAKDSSVPRRLEMGEACFNLASELYIAGDELDEWTQYAQTAYALAHNLNYKNEITCYNLACLYHYYSKQYKKAESCYREGLELGIKKNHSKHAFDILNGLGTLYKDHLSKPDIAETCYQEAISINPKNAATIHCNLGHLYQYYLHNYTKASAQYHKVIELDTNSRFKVYAYNGLGDLNQHYFARYSKAEEYYKKAIELTPDAYVYFNLGNLYLNYQPKSIADVRECYEKAIEVNNQNIVGYVGLAWLNLSHLGNMQMACKYAAQVQAIDALQTWSVFTVYATQLWAQGWLSTKDRVAEVLTKLAKSGYVQESYHWLIQMICRIHHEEHLKHFLVILNQQNHDVWIPWRLAVAAFLEGLQISEQADKHSSAAKDILIALTQQFPLSRRSLKEV